MNRASTSYSLNADVLNTEKLRKHPDYVKWLKGAHLLLEFRAFAEVVVNASSQLLVTDLSRQLAGVGVKCKRLHRSDDNERLCPHCDTVRKFVDANHLKAKEQDPRRLDDYSIYENNSDELSRVQIAKLFMGRYAIHLDDFDSLDSNELTKFLWFCRRATNVTDENKLKHLHDKFAELLNHRNYVFHSMKYMIPQEKLAEVYNTIKDVLANFQGDAAARELIPRTLKNVEIIFNGNDFAIVAKETEAFAEKMREFQRSLRRWEEKARCSIKSDRGYYDHQLQQEGEMLKQHMDAHVKLMRTWMKENVVGTSQFTTRRDRGCTTVGDVIPAMDKQLKNLGAKVTDLDGEVTKLEDLVTSLENKWHTSKDLWKLAARDDKNDYLNALSSEVTNFTAICNNACNVTAQIKKDGELARQVEEQLKALYSAFREEKKVGHLLPCRDYTEMKTNVIEVLKRTLMPKAEVQVLKKKVDCILAWIQINGNCSEDTSSFRNFRKAVRNLRKMVAKLSEFDT